MMHALIYGKTVTNEQVPFVNQLFDLLLAERAVVYVYEPYFQEIKDKVKIDTRIELISSYFDLTDKKIDYVMTLGGDGTILSAVTLIRDLQIPIMGINLGRLGFLASIEQRYIDRALDLLKIGKFSLQGRTMLYLDSSQPIFGETPFALNDFAILKRDNSSMIIIHAYINGEFLNSYWADGLIVSTPTGSTGYNLSCGGPIVFPDSNSLILTPVAPHNLNVRPIVISDDTELSFEVEGRTENFLCTLDSRFELITSEYKLKIRKCEFEIRLVQLHEMSIAKTMRNKLMWGFDTRKHY